MEDISIEQRKSILNREKGLELQASYTGAPNEDIVQNHLT